MMLLKLAWRNVWRNKRRSVITIAMVALAVFLAICMRSMQLGTYDRMIEGLVKYSTGYVRISSMGYDKDKDINKRSLCIWGILWEPLENPWGTLGEPLGSS